MPIIVAIPDEAQQTHDKNHARRLVAMLMLHQGMTVTDVARLRCALFRWQMDKLVYPAWC